MKIAFGCDPNAEDFKRQLMEYVKGLGHETEDFGTFTKTWNNNKLGSLYKLWLY